MKVHHFKHKKQRVQEKANFFADYLSFVAQYIGRLPYLPLDTPLSIIDKINFQLTNNIKRCKSFVLNHLSNFRFYNERLFEDCSTHLELDQLIFKIIEENRTTEIKNSRFKDVIKAFKNELEDHFVDTLIRQLFTLVNCKHSLNFHKKEIKHLTLNLVAHLLLNGNSIETIRKLSNEIFKKSSNGGTLLDQFNKIKYLQSNILENERTFIFRINNCYPRKEEERTFAFSYNDVEFISYKHSRIKEIRKEARKEKNVDFNDAFFKGRNHILGLVKVKFGDKVVASDYAKDKINEELNYLKTIIRSNEIYLLEGGYIQIDKNDWTDFRGTVKIAPKKVQLERSKFFGLSEYKHKTENIERLKNYIDASSLFYEAQTSRSLNKYWHYLEILLPKRIAENGNEENQIEDIFKNVMKSQNVFWRNSICSLILKSSVGILAVKIFKTKIVHEEMLINMKISNGTKNAFSEMNKLFHELKYESIKDTFRDLKKECRKSNKEKWSNYYKSLITELREYRNSNIHKGKSNIYLETKLKILIPDLINFFRWNWWHFIKKNTPNENGEYDFNNIR